MVVRSSRPWAAHTKMVVAALGRSYEDGCRGLEAARTGMVVAALGRSYRRDYDAAFLE